MNEGAAPAPPRPSLPLVAETLARALRARSPRPLVGRRIRLAASVESTNDEAGAALRRAPAPSSLDGWAFLALHQGRGRGRLGRAWFAQPGSSVLASVILASAPPSVPAVTACAALAVADAAGAFLPTRPDLKWPNDVLAGGRKLAGILVEARGDSRSGPIYVAGVGINVSQAAEDFPDDLRSTATSIRLLRGRAPDLGEVAAAFLASLERRYSQLRRGEISRLEEDFLERLGLRGREVALVTGGRTLRGRLEDLSFEKGVRWTGGAGSTTLPCEVVSAIGPV